MAAAFTRGSTAEGPPNRSRGELTKTIAHARAAGETALTVHCLAQGCYHQAVKTFEELRLWNDMTVLRCRSIGDLSVRNVEAGT